MYRLLVVDDEHYLVRTLVGLIKEAEFNDLEVYGATSAAEALERLNRTKVDIALLDICIPGMDGLELQKEIMKQWPRCKVIFLTGHNEFEYAKQALRHQAIDYILKTEGDHTILQAIERALSDLSQEFEVGELMQKASQQLRAWLPSLQKEYLWDVLQGNPNALRNMRNQFNELQISLADDLPIMLVLGRVDRWHEEIGRSDAALLLYAIRNISEEYLCSSARLAVFSYENCRLVWMIQPLEPESSTDHPEEVWSRLIRFVHGMLERIQQTCKELLKLTVSFAASDEYCSWFNVSEKFDVCKFLFNSGFGIGEELLLTENDFIEEHSNRTKDLEIQSQLKKMEDLASFLQSGQRVEFHKAFTEVMKAGYIASDIDSSRLVIFYNLTSTFLSHIAKEGMRVTIGQSLDLAKLTRYELHLSWDDVFDYFGQLANLIFEERKTEMQQKGHDLLYRIGKYIDENIGGDLSLTRIGELVSFNPFYLSRIYKHLSGSNLTETIMEARLSRAKQLLLQSDMKIQDITAAVGFESPAYFTRFFKKATGMSPQQYREGNGS